MNRAISSSLKWRGPVVLEREEGRGRLGRGFFSLLDRAAIARGAAGFEALADVILRDARGTGVAERFVPASVVSVIVRVDDEAYRLVRNLQFLQRCLRSEEHTSELQSQANLVWRRLL